MIKILKIDASIFRAIHSLPEQDRKDIIDAVLWYSFYPDYYSGLDGHNQAIFELIIKILHGGE
jgi:hypothetical protein